MLLDASAIIALILETPNAAELERRLSEHTGALYITPVGRYEAVMGIALLKSAKSQAIPADIITAALAMVDSLIASLGVKDVPIQGDIGTRAIQAAKVYGKLSGHPANLNMGDCFTYACAKANRLSLLYAGGEFALTDIA